METPILITGAAGGLGGVGKTIVEILRQRHLPVRALVHRDDARAEALRASGADVVIGDLTQPQDVARALAGCRRLYFGMSASAAYLEVTVIAAAVARAQGESGGIRQYLSDDRLPDEPDRDDGFTPATAAFSGRAGFELVRIARRPSTRHGFPPEPIFPGLGC
jgi:uncharacterized protein YbjT (DUF2867 family)